MIITKRPRNPVLVALLLRQNACVKPVKIAACMMGWPDLERGEDLSLSTIAVALSG